MGTIDLKRLFQERLKWVDGRCGEVIENAGRQKWWARADGCAFARSYYDPVDEFEVPFY
jgi:hypothetical protein